MFLFYLILSTVRLKRIELNYLMNYKVVLGIAVQYFPINTVHSVLFNK